ncbi:DUF2336 domain-containing protein [Pseudaminobacter soli (ex Li et al. 2025)]|uniref:DUF2336 domain-containing protein n=1 Tax=Pseudaminobacter soli (ex Li et al. 2025) TaxID=1295366 RepID=A0A2P7SFT7_9HYPH|nr:DUF2336 domain-containing protein [Mesorhizobium soli]PSJ61354.1 hypothetical protein C7I85_09790 [Mesorhizobium soli]
MKGEAGKSERLFRAAISAFCSLTRPTRREISQLEDLALPLFDQVSVDARRFASAALSECDYAPRKLIQRLCNETVDIAAPLLIRSKLLRDIDLITLIGRHGLPHARAIARRPNLNSAIAHLIRALSHSKPAVTSETAHEPLPGVSADNARRRLRSMMLPSQESPADSNEGMPEYAKLRDTALTGSASLFQMALAGASGLDYRTAKSVTDTTDQSLLLAALRSLDLSEERAFLIAAALFPGRYAHAEAIRLFLLRYRSLDPEAARERIRVCKADAIAAAVRASNSQQDRSQDSQKLKAS